MKILITGSSGLIGSEAVRYFGKKGHTVLGIDNNQRKEFFGVGGDTTWNLELLKKEVKSFQHFSYDIRDRISIFEFFKSNRFDVIIHCAAQPSHDKAREIPIIDFEVNAAGTVNLLEATRKYNLDAIFVFMSTNKVYGDAPNYIPLKELETRWDYDSETYVNGIDETFQIDRCLHSLFGASKVAADIMTQEYGKYFGMNTVCLRGGCLTGPRHSGVELHGFLSYLIHIAMTGKKYTIFGYKGKQVRDQIHSEDVIGAIEAYIGNPRPGEVYNMGGGRGNSASILECITKIEALTQKKINYDYIEQNRIGDHICYISDLSKFKSHYPNWKIKHDLDEIIEEMVEKEVDIRKNANIN